LRGAVGKNSGAVEAARGERGRCFHHRTVFVPTEFEAAARQQGQQGSTDGKGNRDPAVPIPRRPKVDLPRSSAAGGMGIQFRRDHSHAGAAYLSTAPKNGKRRSDATDLGDVGRGGEIQST